MLAGFALLLAGTQALPAAGLLGRRHVSVTYDHVNYEGAAWESGNGFTLLYNQPLREKIDFSLSYTDYERPTNRTDRTDLFGRRVMLETTFIGHSKGCRTYARFGLGWAEEEYNFAKNDAIMHRLEAGAEFPVGDRTSLTPFLNWTDAFNDDVDGTLTYGVVAAVDAGNSLSLIGRLVGDDHFNVIISVGAAFRF
jgi:hypothetical protein